MLHAHTVCGTTTGLGHVSGSVTCSQVGNLDLGHVSGQVLYMLTVIEIGGLGHVSVHITVSHKVQRYLGHIRGPIRCSQVGLFKMLDLSVIELRVPVHRCMPLLGLRHVNGHIRCSKVGI